jgi:hypothetical protein
MLPFSNPKQNDYGIIERLLREEVSHEGKYIIGGSHV